MVKILVADDSEFMRGMIKEALTEAGYSEFIEAKDKTEAVEKFKNEKPDLVLLDIVMAESTGGLVALKEIKTLDPNAKIIMVTVMDQPQMTEEAKKIGALDYIPKPIDKTKLVEAVKKALGQ